MSGFEQIHDGMLVYGADEQPLGTIEHVTRDRIRVNGREVSRDNIARVTGDRVYVRGTGADYLEQADYAQGTTMRDRGEVTVPKVEERLNVEKREGELGAVDIHKLVTEEQRTVPVDLQREEVHVEERNVADRPLRPGEDVFQEGTIRVPVRGEEAIVKKEAVVTGEVAVTKAQTTEHQEIRDTVRRQDVDVDENYRQARRGFQEHFTQRGWGKQRTWDQAEPNYRYGYQAAQDRRYAGQEWDEAEPALRRDYESAQTGDTWDELREEIREGWRRARGR